MFFAVRMDYQLLVASVLILGTYTSIATDTDQPVIYFSLIVSNASAGNTSGIVSAVNQTLRHVNGDATRIIPGYHLQYNEVLDIQYCSDNKKGLNQLTKFIYNFNESMVRAIIGCGCSLATEKVARALSRSDIPIISYASTSAALSDRSVYPNLFRTVPSDESLAPALATVMQYYGWRTLSILTEQEAQFMELIQLLDISLSVASISIDKSVYFNAENLTEAADTIFEGDSHIIVLNSNPKTALFYLCRAFKEERSYPGYVWITPGWYQQGWWKTDEDYIHSLNCTFSDIEQQLNRSLVLLAHPNTNFPNITEPYNSSSYVMDAVITLALALNETLENPSLNLSLQPTAIEAIMFTGASGIIQFDDHGNRLNPAVLLQQFRIDSYGSLTLHTFARIHQMDTNITLSYINGETNSTVWPDSRGIPPIIVTINVITPSVYAYLAVLVTIGVMLSIVCLMFTVIFKNRKVIKLTSPNLNYMIVLGALLLMIGNLFPPGFPSRNKDLLGILCIIRRTAVAIGYDICFAVALVKTARVVYIFRKVAPTTKKVKDKYLFLWSVGIVMIEVVYVIPLLILTYVNGDTRLEADSENPSFTNEYGYRVVYYVILCDHSSIYVTFFSLVIVHKVVIHVIGLVLAFLTRKIKIESLNDSRYSMIIIYCSCIIIVLLGIIIFVVSGVNIDAILWTSVIFIEVCLVLGFTFIPKMVLLYKDPQGKRIFSATAPSSSVTRGINDGHHQDHIKAQEN